MNQQIHEDECPCDFHQCDYSCKSCTCSDEWKEADIRTAYQKELDERNQDGVAK